MQHRCAQRSASVAADLAEPAVERASLYAQGPYLLGCRRRGGDLRIEVWHTGVGIAAEDQKRIFEEFHRLAPGSEKGLGLGLAIVDRVSRLLGHAVDVRSRPGRGSCFAVTVPLARGAGLRFSASRQARRRQWQSVR
ncbi:sensor histidine kinase [Bradyrhizobium japonicum]